MHKLMRSLPIGLIALLVALVLGMTACSSTQPGVDDDPPPVEDSGPEGPDTEPEVPEGDEKDPGGEDGDKDDPPAEDVDPDEPPGDDEGDAGDTPDDEADDEGDAGPPDEDEGEGEDGSEGEADAGPAVAVSGLQTVLRVNTALNGEGVEETVLMLGATIEFEEPAPEATHVTVTLLTGDGAVSGVPLKLDVAAGEESVALEAVGHDWGMLAHDTYRVSVAAMGEPTVNEHDVSWLPGGLEVPSNLAMTMSAPDEMRITFDQATGALIHYVSASYTVGDDVRTRNGMGHGEAHFSSSTNFEVLLGREYELSVMAEVAQFAGDHGLTRFTSEATATLELGQVPAISAWFGPSVNEVMRTRYEGYFGRLFVTMPAGFESGTEIDALHGAGSGNQNLSITPSPAAGPDQAWLIGPIQADSPRGAALKVTVTHSGEQLADYAADYAFVRVASMEVTKPEPKAGRLTFDDLRLSWTRVPDASHYMVDLGENGAEIVFSDVTSSTEILIPFTDDFEITASEVEDYFVRVFALNGDPDDPTERVVSSSMYVNLLSEFLPVIK